MDFFSIVTALGGLALLLYGMNTMSSSLERVAGKKLEHIIAKVTNKPIKGVLIGIAVTALMQSSSLATVMVVGFVNSGIMNLNQVVGVIMGANMGTTVTSWILSLVSLDTNNFFLNLVKPNNFAPIAGVIGIILIMAGKRRKNKDMGRILIGFFMLMFGMVTMSEAVKPIADMPGFADVLLFFSNPLLGILVGAVITAVVQSSAASIGVLQALATTGAVTYGTAIPILLGQNIGTTATSLISSIGANKNARRSAMLHFYFNVIGVSIFLLGIYGGNLLFKFAFLDSPMSVVQIALTHTIFNSITTAIMLPLSKYLVKLVEITVKDKGTAIEKVVLDERLLATPSIAVEQCKKHMVHMAEATRENILLAMPLIWNYDAKIVQRIIDNEEIVDLYEDKLGTFLVKLSGREMPERENREASKILHSLSDFERISDHACNIKDVAQELYDKNITFSGAAQKELLTMAAAVKEIIELTVDAYIKDDVVKAYAVEPLEQVIDELKLILKAHHVERLKAGDCTIELGFILSDLINNYERVADHCSNIAILTMQIRKGAVEAHEYLKDIHQSTTEEYKTIFEEFREKYNINGENNTV